MDDKEFRLALIGILRNLTAATQEVCRNTQAISDTDFYIPGEKDLERVAKQIEELEKTITSP